MGGLVASSLIGAIYFSPSMMVILALLPRRNRQPSATRFSWFAAVLVVSVMLIVAGETLYLPQALMLGTTAFVLATLSPSALAVGTILQMFKHEVFRLKR